MQRGAWGDATWSMRRCNVEHEAMQRGAWGDATWSVGRCNVLCEKGLSEAIGFGAGLGIIGSLGRRFFWGRKARAGYDEIATYGTGGGGADGKSS